MHHLKFDPEAGLEDRLGAIEKYLESLQAHRDSRRGLDGIRGEKGEKGDPGVSNVPGEKGEPGKDADITEVVELAIKKVREQFDEEHRVLAQTILHQLKVSGVVDEFGKAVLIPGQTGATGAQGSKGDPGRSGVDGKSVVGPAGKPAKIVIGDVVAGTEASVSVRQESDNTYVFSFVLPRGEKGETGATGADSTVAGPRGERGIDGLRGYPGIGVSEDRVIEIVSDMARRGRLKG